MSQIVTSTSAPVNRPTSALLAVVAVTLLLGAVTGAVWTAVTPAMTGRVLGADSAIIPAEQFPEEFAAVGTFALLLVAYGIVCALVSWFAARTWRGPGGFVIVAASSVLGAALAAWVGTGLADWRFDGPLDVGVGATFRVVPHLWLNSDAEGFSSPWILLICAPLAVALAYLICTLLAKTGDLGVGDLHDHDDRANVAADAGPEITSADAASRIHR